MQCVSSFTVLFFNNRAIGPDAQELLNFCGYCSIKIQTLYSFLIWFCIFVVFAPVNFLFVFYIMPSEK